MAPAATHNVKMFPLKWSSFCFTQKSLKCQRNYTEVLLNTSPETIWIKQAMACVRVCSCHMGRHSWTELKAPLTQRSEARWKYCCGGASLKIPGRAAISGVCAEQLLRFRALSVSNYCTVHVCVCADMSTPNLPGVSCPQYLYLPCI